MSSEWERETLRKKDRQDAIPPDAKENSSPFSFFRKNCTIIWDERCGRPTCSLSISCTETEELLDVGGEQLPPGTGGVIQKDGVNDEGEQPLAVVPADLKTGRGVFRDAGSLFG